MSRRQGTVDSLSNPLLKAQTWRNPEIWNSNKGCQESREDTPEKRWMSTCNLGSRLVYHELLNKWLPGKWLAGLCFPPMNQYSAGEGYLNECAASIQFPSVSPPLYNPMDCSMPGLLVHHQLPEFTQTHVHWVDDPIQPSHPLLSPSPPTFSLSQYQGLFKLVSSSHQN